MNSKIDSVIASILPPLFLRFVFLYLLVFGLQACVIGASVIIEDPVLEKLIRRTLRHVDEPITVSHMQSLTKLSMEQAPRRDSGIIRSLEGLQWADNLVELALIGHSARGGGRYPLLQLNDYGPLVALKKLEVLNLAFNDLDSIDLPNMPNLRELHLAWNRLTQFRLPDGMTSLEVLDLNYQFSPYGIDGGREDGLEHVVLPLGLHRLETLNLSNNHLKELVLPTGMVNLRELYLYNQENYWEDADLEEYHFSKLSLPNDLKQLEILDINTFGLTQLRLPSGLDQLRVLKLREGTLQTLFVDSSMPLLEEIHVNRDAYQSRDLPETPVSIYFPYHLTPHRLWDWKLSNASFFAYLPFAMKRSTDGLILEWNQGNLYASSKPSGAWSAIPEATSPYLVPMHLENQFFKVMIPDAVEVLYLDNGLGCDNDVGY